MRKRITLLLVILLACTLLPHCGGGGASTISPNPVTNTPTTAPTATPTTQTQPTATNTPTVTTNHLEGNTYDITNNSVVTGCNINLNGEDFNTTNGLFDFEYPNGNNIITISGPNNITFTSPIDPQIENQNFYLLPFDFNTTFLRAMIFRKDTTDPNIIYNQDVLRWNTPPHIRIYTKMPYSNVDVTTIANDIESILLEIKNYNFNTLENLTIEKFDGSPLDDSDWKTDDDSTTTHFIGYIDSNNTIGICIAPLEGAGGLTSAVYSDATGEYSGGGITLTHANPPLSDDYKAKIWHELGHALMGVYHPFENIAQADWPTLLELSNMNYSSTGKKSNTYSQYDIWVFKFIYNRASNNSSPDNNPSAFNTSSVNDKKIIKFTDPTNI